jgi:hypothetical protein
MLPRLLMASGALAAFSPSQVLTLTTAPQGGWAIPNPSAYYYNGKTYIGWTSESPGDIKVASFDHASQVMSSPFVLGTNFPNDGAYDLHDNPSVMVRPSDGRIVVAYCGHEDTRMRVRISTNPEDVSAFDAEQALDLGAAYYTYPTLVQLRGVTDDPIYLFYRDMTANTPPVTARLAYSVSTDGGATWAAQTRVFTGAANLAPYWEIGSDWDTRVDVICTNKSPNASAQTLSHFYILGGLYYKSDGTQITATLPFATTDMTQVLAAGNASFPGGIVTDPAGPTCIYMLDSSGTDYAIKTARWRSGAWSTTTILASVGGSHANNDFLPSCAVDVFDPDVVWAGVKSGSYYEIKRYDSSDDGSTWTPTTITSGSSADNLFVEPVTFGTSIRALWLYGTYTGDTNYSLGIKAFRG